MNSYQDLLVWQKSMLIVELVYKVTAKFPKSEIFGLSSQMQRAAVAMPSNIAEGSKRNHVLEYIQFLSVANGSAAELQTQLLIAKKLFPDSKNNLDEILSLTEEILKMLHVMITKIRRNKL